MKPIPKPPRKKPYKDKSLEALPLWIQDLVYEAATYNLSIRQLAERFRKSPKALQRALTLPTVRTAINEQKAKLRDAQDKQLKVIDKTAINRVQEILETVTNPAIVANLAVKHLKGRGIYVEGEKVEHSGKIEVIIEKELADKPAEEPVSDA